MSKRSPIIAPYIIKNIMEPTRVVLFGSSKIRKTLCGDEWWFSVVDVCETLTDSVDPGAYWRKLKQRLIEEGSEVVTNCHGLKLSALDGKMRETDCANTDASAEVPLRGRYLSHHPIHSLCLAKEPPRKFIVRRIPKVCQSLRVMQKPEVTSPAARENNSKIALVGQS